MNRLTGYLKVQKTERQYRKAVYSCHLIAGLPDGNGGKVDFSIPEGAWDRYGGL